MAFINKETEVNIAYLLQFYLHFLLNFFGDIFVFIFPEEVEDPEVPSFL